MANTPNLDLENVNVLTDTEYAYNQLVSEIIAKINNNNLKIDELPNDFILSNEKGIANGVASLGNDGIIPKAQLPTDTGSVEKVADITARDAIVNLYDNKLVFVIDASTDVTVTSGWAMYIYSSGSLSWTKIVDGESLDLELTWDNILNKPTDFPPETHTHAQIDINAQNITDLQNTKVDTIEGSRLVSETEIEVFNDKYSKTEVDNKLSMLETNIDWKESVATFADIATTYPSPVDGWTVNVKDTDYTYRYNGTSWIAISANAIPKATTTEDGLMSKEYVTQVDTNKTDILSLEATVGDVAMTTTTQTVTGAINELDADIGNKATLTTTDKTNLVNAVNETKAQINSLGAQEDNYLTNADGILNIPSYVGNNSAQHPSVVDFGLTKWNGYRYWMAYTPYPDTNFENPSICASNDNKTWILPVGCPNPVVPAPIDGELNLTNSDPELIYISETNKLRLYWREYAEDNSIRYIYYIESVDGITWSERVLIITSTTEQMLSPSIVKVASNDYRMWYINTATNIGYRTSSDGITWSEPTIITQGWSNYSAWHIGVAKDNNGRFHMMGNTRPVTAVDYIQYRPLIYAYSDNGVNWTFIDTEQLFNTGMAAGFLYRPSLIVDNTKPLKNGLPYVRVWYGVQENNDSLNEGIMYSEGYIHNGADEFFSKEKLRKKIIEGFKGVFANIQAGYGSIASLWTRKLHINGGYFAPQLFFKDNRSVSIAGKELQIEFVTNTSDGSVRLRYWYDDALVQEHSFSAYKFLDLPNYTLKGLKELCLTGTNGCVIAGLNTTGQIVNIASWNKSRWDFKDKIIQNLNALMVKEVDISDHQRFYKPSSTTEYNTIKTDSNGNLELRANSLGNTFRVILAPDSGYMDLSNAQGIVGTGIVDYVPQTARPARCSTNRCVTFMADGVVYNPCSDASGKPYLVFYNGYTDTFTKVG